MLENKKAQSTGFIVFAVIFIFIIIIGVIVVVVMNNDVTKTDVKNPSVMKVFLTSTDSNSHAQISTIFMIFENGTLVSNGRTILDSPIEVVIPLNKSIDVYCWNNDYYVGEVHENLTNYDLSFNSSSIDCEADKIGKLDITVSGDIQNPQNTLIFNLTSRDGKIEKLGACMSWSIGIDSVEDYNNYVQCGYGDWKAMNDSNNTYSCGGKLEECGSIVGSLCRPLDMETPDRFRNKVDKCSYFGGTIEKDQSRQISINIDTYQYKNSFDYFEITFFDEYQMYLGNKWQYSYQDQGGNHIGMNDTSARIQYKAN